MFTNRHIARTVGIDATSPAEARRKGIAKLRSLGFDLRGGTVEIVGVRRRRDALNRRRYTVGISYRNLPAY